MTLSKHDSLTSSWKYQSVHCPCTLSEIGGTAASPGAQRVSGLERHCPRTSGTTASLLWLSDPRHVEPLSPWMTYTQPHAGAANLGSLELNTCWLGGAAGSRIIQRATSQSDSPVGFRPTQEQLTSATKYDALIFPRSWLRQEERTPDWKLRGWQSMIAPDN